MKPLLMRALLAWIGRGRFQVSLPRFLWVCVFSADFLILPVAALPVPEIREQPWRLASFIEDSGLARRIIFNLAFTPDNTAWLAASDGLYRYDGYTWKKFTTADGLPSNFIRTATVTRRGTLWIGSDQGAGTLDGHRYDPQGTQKFLAEPNVRRIVEAPDGALWFCYDRWPDTPPSPGG